jgi:phosphate transport system permease protein
MRQAMAATTDFQAADHPGKAARLARRFTAQDSAFITTALVCATIVVLLLVAVIFTLIEGSWPALAKFGPAFLWTERWSPVKEIFGALAPIYGTIISSLIAMVIGVPVSFGIAIFLTELCPPRLRRPIGTAIELLAGIPSIIYGLWGFFILAPFLAVTVQPFLDATLGKVPGIGLLFVNSGTGLNLLTGGIILAIMILPFITSISRDVFLTVPVLLRESAYGMGMTTWEVIRHIVIPYTRVGLVGGVMLGLGRALGETMAVTFVIGNSHNIAASLLAPSTTISATIANEFTEATSGVYTSSLIALGLILFAITLIVLGVAKWLIMRTEKY